MLHKAEGTSTDVVSCTLLDPVETTCLICGDGAKRAELQVSEKWSLLWFCLVTQEKDNKAMYIPLPLPAVFQSVQPLTHPKLITLTPQSFLLLLANLD